MWIFMNLSTKDRILLFLYRNRDSTFAWLDLENEFKTMKDFKESLAMLVSDGLVTKSDRSEPNPYTGEKPAYFRIHSNGVTYVQSRRNYFFSAVTFILLLIGTVSIKRCSDSKFVNSIWQKSGGVSDPIKTIPAILEDSLQDQTNTLLDTISGKATPTDSSQTNPYND